MLPAMRAVVRRRSSAMRPGSTLRIQDRFGIHQVATSTPTRLAVQSLEMLASIRGHLPTCSPTSKHGSRIRRVPLAGCCGETNRRRVRRVASIRANHSTARWCRHSSSNTRLSRRQGRSHFFCSLRRLRNRLGGDEPDQPPLVPHWPSRIAMSSPSTIPSPLMSPEGALPVSKNSISPV